MSVDAARVTELLNTGLADHNAGRLVPAETAYRRALALDARHPIAHYNLAIILQATQRPAEAEAHYRESLAIQPRNPGAWNNMSNLLGDLGRWSEAEAASRKVTELQPDHPTARMNLAFTLLATGHYQAAWPLYETRLTAYNNIMPALRCPLWTGDGLAGRRLLVVCEQGFGDAVQFIRYAPLLQARGAASVTVLCRPALAPLLATCRGIQRIVFQDDGQQDLYVPLLSLPMLLGTADVASIPVAPAYLRALPARVESWAPRLPAAKHRVGLVWKGSQAHANDHNRSLPLEMLKPLWGVPDVAFVSLQKGAGERDADHAPPDQPIAPLGAQIQDFGDLAAVIQLLDLVITVDTAAAHVAGALGKPCWVLLPAYGCDWRWFGGADPTRAPWYPHKMRLVHQPPSGNWAPVLQGLPSQLQVALSAG